MWTSEKTWKVLKGAGIAAAGAGLAYLTAYAASLDLGAYGPVLGAALSTAANVLRQLATRHAEGEASAEESEVQ